MIRDNVFGRMDENGNVMILYREDGLPVTRLNDDVYPVNSNLSARYEHPKGIVLSTLDAACLGIEIED